MGTIAVKLIPLPRCLLCAPGPVYCNTSMGGLSRGHETYEIPCVVSSLYATSPGKKETHVTPNVSAREDGKGEPEEEERRD